MGIRQETIYNKPLGSPFGDEAQRWEAVQARDSAADGLFVYAVKTTKIYCRPICKARLARRANVSFYETGLEAQNAGFRACKRCKPELAGCMPEELAVRKIRAFVEEQRRGKILAATTTAVPVADDRRSGNSTDTRLSLSQMARQTGLSKWHFHRVFKRCVGLTPSEFLRSEKEAAASSTSLSSESSTSGTLSPWIESDLDVGLGWPTPRERVEELDFALFDVESGWVPPLNDAGLSWEDGDMFLDDFLVWQEDGGTKG